MRELYHAEKMLKELICFNFYRGWRGISEFYRTSLPQGVSAQQSYIIELCDADQGVLVSQIANALEIEMSAISGMLRRMEANGIIRRETRSENRRQTLVFLTKSGVRLRKQVRTRMIEADKELRRIIPASKIRELISVVDRIRSLDSSKG